ncbi:TetR/AcrR family transcriptional regulator C-terminal ligand-binding domain-containing protein [Promicromonospora sp. NPDC023805]|uniref:TetR/AcrR family transcriptional regulator n=1 Tax=Promicromonospora sp. NPDC023805 TaxID=3154696 RepID=UPI0033FBDAA8
MTGTRTGRPRSEATRLAILEAAAALTTELGYDHVTIDAIASRAGAGKQTIYRWWSAKPMVVADAVIEGFLRLPALDLPDTGDLSADLKAWTTTSAAAMGDSRFLQVVRALVTAATGPEQDASRLYEHIMRPTYEPLLARLRRDQDAGLLSTAVSAESVADALLGTLLFRALARLPMPETMAGIIDALLAPTAAAGTDC